MVLGKVRRERKKDGRRKGGEREKCKERREMERGTAKNKERWMYVEK